MEERERERERERLRVGSSARNKRARRERPEGEKLVVDCEKIEKFKAVGEGKPNHNAQKLLVARSTSRKKIMLALSMCKGHANKLSTGNKEQLPTKITAFQGTAGCEGNR